MNDDPLCYSCLKYTTLPYCYQCPDIDKPGLRHKRILKKGNKCPDCCPGNLEPCETDQPGQKKEQPIPSGETKIFCYRDLLKMEYEEEEDDKDEPTERNYYRRTGKNRQLPAYGITLYFVEGTTPDKEQAAAPGGISQIFSIIEVIHGHIKKDKEFDTGRAIERLFLKKSPIVDFIISCISAGTKKTKCYNEARKAGLKIRKQTALALYEYIRLVPKLCTVTTPAEIPPPIAFFERVRDFFKDAFQSDVYFMQFEYIENELSVCSASEIESAGEIARNDFLFEMGELNTGTLKYFGHYRAETERMIARVDWMDIAELEQILTER